MTYPKAIFFSAIVIALAIAFASISPVKSQMGGGAFTIASDGTNFVWRVDGSTGAVSYCVRRDSSLDPVVVGRSQPYCSTPSAPAK